jgi:hypothetical protein
MLEDQDWPDGRGSCLDRLCFVLRAAALALFFVSQLIYPRLEARSVTRLVIPNSATIHNARAFFSRNDPFGGSQREAVLEFHSKWVHMEPVALVAAAAWGAWARRSGMDIRAEHLGRQANYAARMGLFEILGIDYSPGIIAREEAGRFLPLKQVTRSRQIPSIIGDISALLHLQNDPDTLSTVQYCLSELIRNVLEHSKSPDGAFLCAHRFTEAEPHRVTIAVADCGQGIAAHLGRVYPEAIDNDVAALGLAMQPGITGAVSGIYGTPDNAGAGLFITRCMAKGSGGYFLILSGTAAYRIRRSRSDAHMTDLFLDPYDEPDADSWTFAHPWKGTIVSVEIRAEKIGDYDGFIRWIFEKIPRREPTHRRIRFT